MPRHPPLPPCVFSWSDSYLSVGLTLIAIQHHFTLVQGGSERWSQKRRAEPVGWHQLHATHVGKKPPEFDGPRRYILAFIRVC